MCPFQPTETELVCDGTGVLWKTFCTELFGTFILVSTVLTKKFKDTSGDHNGNAFVIAFVLAGLVVMCAGISGACFNPAFGLVQQLFQ